MHFLSNSRKKWKNLNVYLNHIFSAENGKGVCLFVTARLLSHRSRHSPNFPVGGHFKFILLLLNITSGCGKCLTYFIYYTLFGRLLMFVQKAPPCHSEEPNHHIWWLEKAITVSSHNQKKEYFQSPAVVSFNRSREQKATELQWVTDLLWLDSNATYH